MHALLNLFKISFLFLLALASYPFLKKKSVYYFLKFCGPTFVKLGQLLSTRPDLVGKDLARVLSDFQDKLPPFSFKKAKEIIEKEQGLDLNKIFAEFAEKPVASASIAQVHKAKLLSGEVVAVKVLRPNIRRIMKRDVASLRLISALIGVFSFYAKEKINDILDLLQNCCARELDLMQEASAAVTLKENLADISGFYIPKIYWNFTSSRVLTCEWIDGIAFSNKEAIRNSKFNKKEIARNLVISYFSQVYRDGFFHADMHPGNLFLMENGDIAAVDFGIIGIIDRKIRIAIAEIVIAFLKRDYVKVAELHVKAGLVPEDIDIAEFALTARIIGEATVDLSVKQVALGKLLGMLIKMTRKYKIKTKPELLLLQKTILLVEGVGAELDPDLNIWQLAGPWMEDWAKKNIGFDAKIVDLFLDLFKKFSGNCDNRDNRQEKALMEEIEKLKRKQEKLKRALILVVVLVLGFWLWVYWG